MNRSQVWLVLSSLLILGLARRANGGGLQNPDPGGNHLNVVAAFGDSITLGNQCDCPAYPTRMGTLTGEQVYNAGIGGSGARHSIARTQTVIDQVHPAFMMILYGVNDVCSGVNVDSIEGYLGQMVSICKQNHVVPVLATYPEPILDYAWAGYRVKLLNQKIRSLAAAQFIPCVDAELAFAAKSEFYNSDGLHPNHLGTELMALAFADLF